MPVVLLAVVVFIGIGVLSPRLGWLQTALIATTVLALAVIQLTLPRFL